MPQTSTGLAHRAAWQVERKSSWLLLFSSMACSSRHWMDLACDQWSESAWEAPWASASLTVVEQRFLASWMEWTQVALTSLMVVEQRVSASWVEWVQMALASLMDSDVSELFWQRSMSSSQTNFCWWAWMDDLVASSPPRALLASSQRWPVSAGGAPPLGPGVLAVGE